MSDIELYQQHYDLGERNTEEELDYITNDEGLKGIISSEDASLYAKFVESGFDVTNYKINPCFNEIAGIRNFDVTKLIKGSKIRWKSMATIAWTDSLNLNHLLAYYKDAYGKFGESQFWAELYKECKIDENDSDVVKRFRHHISSQLLLAQKLTLKQAVILQEAGISVTNLKRLTAPKTPREAITAAIAEARDGGTLTNEAIADILDDAKNGISTDDFLTVTATAVNDNQGGSSNDDADDNSVIVGGNSNQSAESSTEAVIINRKTAEELERVKQEKQCLERQIEELKNHQAEPQEFQVPEGYMLLDAEEVTALKSWINYWAFKFEVTSPRGKGILTALAHMKEMLPRLVTINVPVPVEPKKSK